MEPVARFLLRSYQDKNNIPRSYLITMDKVIKNTIPSVQEAEPQSKGPFHPTTTIRPRFHNQNASTC